jgi:hypothetical protein
LLLRFLSVKTVQILSTSHETSSQKTHLLSQNEIGILVVGVLSSLELGDACALLIELLVVAFLFFDIAGEHRSGDYEGRRGGHFVVGEKMFCSFGFGLGAFGLTIAVVRFG